MSNITEGSKSCRNLSCDKMLPLEQHSCLGGSPRRTSHTAEPSPNLPSIIPCISGGPAPTPEVAKGLNLDSVNKVHEAGKSLLRDDLSLFLLTFYATWQQRGLWASEDVNTSILDADSFSSAPDRLTSAYQLVLQVENDLGINSVKLLFAQLILAREDRDYQHYLDQMKMQGLPFKKPVGLSHAAYAQDQALQRIYHTRWELFPPSQKKKEKQKLQRQLCWGRRLMELEAAFELGILLVCNESIRHMCCSSRSYASSVIGFLLTLPNNTDFDIFRTQSSNYS